MENNENFAESTEPLLESTESVSFSQSLNTEYEQLVIDRLDTLISATGYQYSLGLFLTGCFGAIFVLFLLYHFIKKFF